MLIDYINHVCFRQVNATKVPKSTCKSVNSEQAKCSVSIFTVRVCQEPESSKIGDSGLIQFTVIIVGKESGTERIIIRGCVTVNEGSKVVTGIYGVND